MRRLGLTLVFIFVAQILAGGSTLGLDQSKASNITVRPFLQTLQIIPGDATKQFSLTISNDSKFAQSFHLSAVNFGSLNETGGLVFEGANVSTLSNKYGLANWLELNKTSFDLGAGQQTQVKVTIRNDNDLAPGAHYAAVITSASRVSQAAGQLTITPKVSSLVFATKLGGEFYDIHLVSISHNGSFRNLPTNVSLRIKSTGNTYIVPRGVVSLKQNSRVLARGIINPQSSIVLPETIRNFDVPVSPVAKLSRGFLYSSYKIQVDYRYDGINQYATQSTSYKVYNLPFILGLAGLLTATLAGVAVKRRQKPK